jgi:hypothetical protein
MKQLVCPNCHNKREVENDVVMVQCSCGYKMEGEEDEKESKK